MRLPAVASAAGLDIALVGIPWDGGTTNRAGARHGPREMRNQSSLMRRVHHVSGLAPFCLASIADVGDVSVDPIDLLDGLAWPGSRPTCPRSWRLAPSRSAPGETI